MESRKLQSEEPQHLSSSNNQTIVRMTFKTSRAQWLKGTSPYQLGDHQAFSPNDSAMQRRSLDMRRLQQQRKQMNATTASSNWNTLIQNQMRATVQSTTGQNSRSIDINGGQLAPRFNNSVNSSQNQYQDCVNPSLNITQVPLQPLPQMLRNQKPFPILKDQDTGIRISNDYLNDAINKEDISFDTRERLMSNWRQRQQAKLQDGLPSQSYQVSSHLRALTQTAYNPIQQQFPIASQTPILSQKTPNNAQLSIQTPDPNSILPHSIAHNKKKRSITLTQKNTQLTEEIARKKDSSMQTGSEDSVTQLQPSIQYETMKLEDNRDELDEVRIEPDVLNIKSRQRPGSSTGLIAGSKSRSALGGFRGDKPRVPQLNLTCFSGFNIKELSESARRSLLLTSTQSKFYEQRKKKSPNSEEYDAQFNNQLKQITHALNPYLKQKPNASMISDRKYHDERRKIRNTYQLDHLRNLQAQLPKERVNDYKTKPYHDTESSMKDHSLDYQGDNMTRRSIQSTSVNKTDAIMQTNRNTEARSLIRIPKDILLYQLSQKADRSFLDSLMNGGGNSQNNETQSTERRINLNAMPQRESLNKSTLTPQTRNEQLLQNDNEGASVFQITDLLGRAFQNQSDPLNLKYHTLADFYSRTIKGTDDPSTNDKEFMIKNYRLQILNNPSQELSREERDLLGLNPGTTIYVSNSILHPEQFAYTTTLDEEAINSSEPLEKDQPLGKEKIKLQPIPRGKAALKLKEEKEEAELQQLLAKSIDISVFQKPLVQSIVKVESNPKPQQSQANASSDEKIEAILKAEEIVEAKINQLQKLEKEYKDLIESWFINLNLIEKPNEEHCNEDQVSIEKKSTVEQSEEVFDHLKLTKVDKDTIKELSERILELGKVTITAERLQKPILYLNFKEALKTMELIRKQYTHLDPLTLMPECLPIDLFISYEKWVGSLSRRVKHTKHPIIAEISYQPISNQPPIKVIGTVTDFDQDQAKFLVENQELHVKIWKSRMEMRLMDDPKDSQKVASEMSRATALYNQTRDFLRVHYIIVNELTKLYPYITMTDRIRESIQKRLALYRLEIPPSPSVAHLPQYQISLRRLITQSEAHYVFAILKSLLASQKFDPNIKQIL